MWKIKQLWRRIFPHRHVDYLINIPIIDGNIDVEALARALQNRNGRR